MRIARVIGTVTSTVKDHQLAAHPLLVVDVQDAQGKVLDPSVVAVDTLGAGVGQTVLIVSGSAARVPTTIAGIAVDAAIVAIVDEISVGK